MQARTQNSTLVGALTPARGLQRLATMAALVAAGSAFVAGAAQARIDLPFTPVPITGQTFAVLLVGALLGSRLGGAALLTYMLEGIAGFPVFAGGASGWGVIVGPTGGYIVGFIFAAFAVGWLAERGFDRNPLSAAFAMAVGNVIIYVFGLPWLAHFIPDSAVLEGGLYPFVAGDAAKLLLAASLLPVGWAVLRYLPGFESVGPAPGGEFRAGQYRLPLSWLYLIAGALVALGAVLPWGLPEGGSESGLGLRGGAIAFGAGLGGVALALLALPRVIPWEVIRIGQFGVGALAGFASFYWIVQILDASENFSLGDLGAGLFLSALAAVLVVAVSLLDQPQGRAGGEAG